MSSSASCSSSALLRDAVTGRLGEVATGRPGGASSGLSALAQGGYPAEAAPLFITPCAAAAHEGGGARDEWQEEEGREGIVRSLSPPARKEAAREAEGVLMREGMAEAEGVLMRDGSAEAQVEPMGVAHLGRGKG